MYKYIVKEQEGLISKFIGTIFGSILKQFVTDNEKTSVNRCRVKKKKKDLEKNRDDIEKYIKKNKKLQKRYPNIGILTVTRKKELNGGAYKDVET